VLALGRSAHRSAASTTCSTLATLAASGTRRSSVLS